MGAPSDMVIEANDITIMTPQILVNCLNHGEQASLSSFTLMIFDECHNTTGNHPYSVLMSKYLDLKFEQAATPLPQVRRGLVVEKVWERRPKQPKKP